MSLPITDLVCILDRSGSMQPLCDDAIGGFNAFLSAQQALPDEARLTLVLFDHDYERVLDAVPLPEVRPLTRETYLPRGSTALLDAVGRTLDATAERLFAVPPEQRPTGVLVCILTDGQENASTRYSRAAVRREIERLQREHGWDFQFLAANQDAFAEAGGLGIARADAAGFVADAVGTHVAFSLLSDKAAEVRRRKTAPPDA